MSKVDYCKAVAQHNAEKNADAEPGSRVGVDQAYNLNAVGAAPTDTHKGKRRRAVANKKAQQKNYAAAYQECMAAN